MTTKTITKSQLRKMIKEAVLKEQAFSEDDVGTLIDDIEAELMAVRDELGDTIKELQSKQAYISVMLRALDSTEFGGSTDMSVGGMSNPSVALDKGADNLKHLFDEYGYPYLSNQIKKFLETTY